MIPEGNNTVTFFQDRFSLLSEEANITNFEGRAFSTNARANFTMGDVQSQVGTEPPINAEASMILPASLFTGLDLNLNATRLGFVVYSTDVLFQPRPESESAREFENFQVGAPLISAFISNVIVRDLDNPVVFTFQKTVKK